METTVPKLLQRIVRENPNGPAQLSKDSSGTFQTTSYETLYREVSYFAAGLKSLGVERGAHLGLISDNRKEWLIADLAILSLGAADVPRGCDATIDELRYILGFADVQFCLVENESQLEKILGLKSDLKNLKRLAVLDPDFHVESSNVDSRGTDIHEYGEIMDLGRRSLGKDPDEVDREIEQGETDDVATIIFTSGTTGEPKGVMLSHRNFLHQVAGVPLLINVGPGDIWLCVLPVWHSFERIMQYVAVGSASALAYSKPIGKIMLEDFQKVRPTWMASVPRIWESVRAGVFRNVRAQGGITELLFKFFVAVGTAHSQLSFRLRGLLPEFHKRSRLLDVAVSVLPFLLLYPLRSLGNLLVFKKIRNRLGGRFVAGISGGGALPETVDKFFAAAGILLLEGYGLTETGPVLGVRDQNHPVPGTVGPVFPGTEIKIVDDDGGELPPGTKGIVMARGPQVMLGYYKKPELTEAMIDNEGWLNTGDLGMLTVNNELKIVGRAKDTIVLLGGENVEPLPIEDALKESPYIERAVVLGQDQKFLAALLVPDFDALEGFADENSVPYDERSSLVEAPEVQELINSEISELVGPKRGFKSFERVYRFKLLDHDFDLGEELSAKQEVKRHIVAEKYEDDIRKLFG